MLDRVREALFSSAADWMPDARVLDLFAGSGSLGLEALSRDARSARLVEQDKAALKALRDNVELLRLQDRADIRASDALWPSSWSSQEPWDLIFLDPPYALVEDPPARRKLLEALELLLREHLAPDGLLVLHVKRNALREEELAAARASGRRAYGSSELWYLHPPLPEPPE